MDLLATYADDGSDTPKTDSYDKVSESTMSQLEAEWESFQNMMGNDVLGSNDLGSKQSCPPQGTAHVTTATAPSTARRHSHNAKDEEDGESASGSSSESSDEEGDHKEANRQKDGRRRSSSVSSTYSVASSASGKSTSSKNSSDSDKASESSLPAKEEPLDDVVIVDPVKTDNKVAAKRSRSRSGSRSPSRKHRRPSEHSRCSHSRDRHKHLSHSRRERRKPSHHSRSRSRDRHSHRRSSRDKRRHDHRRRRRSGSRSHDSHRRRHRRHSSSRKHSRRHSPDRKKSSDKHPHRRRSPDRPLPRKNSASEAGGKPGEEDGAQRKQGPSVMYRTAGVKFHREAGSSKPLTFKEQMKQQILQSAKLMSENAAAAAAAGGSDSSSKADGLLGEKPSLPLMNPSNLYGNLATSSAGCGIMGLGTVTPQIAFLQTVAALHKQAQEITGVEVPKYYNPAAVNPLKYAEQVQKRKLLWSKAKDKKETNSQWNAQAIVADGDTKTQAKFKKLMGIKVSEEGTSCEAGVSGEGDERVQEQRQKQEELFHHLDKEYEYARMATHTHRGVGLGFGSQIFQHH